jgi:hypothetical protein
MDFGGFEETNNVSHPLNN